MTRLLSERDARICAMYRKGETRSNIAVALGLSYTALGTIMTGLFATGHIEKSADAGHLGRNYERNPLECFTAIDWMDGQDRLAQEHLARCMVVYPDHPGPSPFNWIRALKAGALSRQALAGSMHGSAAALCAEQGR